LKSVLLFALTRLREESTESRSIQGDAAHPIINRITRLLFRGPEPLARDRLPVMNPNASRRRFLRTGLLGSSLSFLSQLPTVSAEETTLDPQIVQLRPEIEPLVRLLESTPREKLTEEMVTRIRNGLSYREVLAALLLAGVRNVQPRPAVGFKFHAVLVVNACHLASQSGPDSDRWLPILWAIDNFKQSQAQDVREGDWAMAPVNESRVPAGHQARSAFVQAMDRWDPEAADAATAGLVRSLASHEVFELFARYAARDLRNIGHKTIFMSNAWRTLDCIGWHHAEPVLRSLAYAFLNHHGEPNPSQSDQDTDRPWRANEKLAFDLRAGWEHGRTDRGATLSLLDALRTATPDEASHLAADMLNGGIAPQSVLDALFLGSAELMMRQPAIPGLHAVTTTNAMHYLAETVGDDFTRRRVFLQNVAIVPMFRQIMSDRGQDLADLRIDTLDAIETGAPEEVIADGDGMRKVRRVIGFAGDAAKAQSLIDHFRRVTFLKGSDAHHYKYSSAMLEDYAQVSPEWRGRFLAGSVLYLPSGKDNPLALQIRQAFA